MWHNPTKEFGSGKLLLTNSFLYTPSGRSFSDAMNSGNQNTLERKMAVICDLLLKEYGDAVTTTKHSPIDTLVRGILSQNTNDINMDRAYQKLISVYPTWDHVLRANDRKLSETILSSGFYKMKARRIQATLREIKRRVGKLNLGFLEKMETGEAMKWLTSLHGVGVKTAAIVLLFCFEKPVLPVDTHVWRVTKRLGLIPMEISRENAQALLERLVPHRCIRSMNHNLVRHGRTICRAQKPLCDGCFLRLYCSFYLTIELDSA